MATGFTGMVQKRRFSGNTRNLRQTLIGPVLERVFASGRHAGTSVPREPRVPQKLQPVSMRLTRQQLARIADSTGVFTAQVPAVVLEN